MHPAAALLLWLELVLLLPLLSLAALSGLLLLPLGFRAHRRWGRLLWRARWLFLTLWLILAYGYPGTAPFDFSALPTWEGMAEANRQALTLLVMLGGLAVFLEWTGPAGLLQALWHLLGPLARHGGAGQTFIVRLALVLQLLEQPAPAGSWRHWLTDAAVPEAGPDCLPLTQIPWTRRDTGKLLVFALCLPALLCL